MDKGLLNIFKEQIEGLERSNNEYFKKCYLQDKKIEAQAAEIERLRATVKQLMEAADGSLCFFDHAIQKQEFLISLYLEDGDDDVVARGRKDLEKAVATREKIQAAIDEAKG